MSYKVSYFPIPGRGEVVRLMLVFGGLPFEDEMFKDWKNRKSKTRWQVTPTLTLPNGRVAGQSRALLRYLGKLVKNPDRVPLYPTDPQQALLVDEVMDFIEDIWAILVPLISLSKEEKTAAAGKLVGEGGRVATMLTLLEDAVTGPFVTGAEMTTADVHIFAALGWWASGFFSQAITVDSLLSVRPKLAGIVERVGQAPLVKKYYAKKEQPFWVNYRQFAKL